MAADQEIALKGVLPQINAASSLMDAQRVLGGETALQAGQQALQSGELANQAGQTKLQMLNRTNQAEDVQFRNQLVANAIAKGTTPEAWDAGMRDAARRGATEATQYIGRYNPVLQRDLMRVYSGGLPAVAQAPSAAPAASGLAGAAGAASPDADLNRLFQNVPPDQMKEILRQMTLASSALRTVKDQPSYDAARRFLLSNNVQGAQQWPDAFSGPAVLGIHDSLQRKMGYLQNRVTEGGMGVPDPLVKNDTKTVSGVEYSIDPYASTAKPITPNIYKPIEGAQDAQGRPLLYSEQGGGIAPAGVPIADVVRRIHKTENDTGNPAATNPRSTAVGNGQFIEGTWLDTVKAARPELSKTLNDKQILALRADPEFSAEMTQALATQNAASLSKAGLPVTTASLTLAHRFGSAGAAKILNAAPNTPMEDIVSKKVMDANPDLAGKTAGDYARGLIRQVGNDPVSDVGPISYKGQYDKPQLVETDDGKGGTTRVLAQQNNRTGQWVTADEKRSPIDANNMVIIPESMGAGGGGRFAGQVIRIMTSAKQATAEIGNLVQLPLESSSGWFAGRGQGPSLLAATKEVLANKVTSQEVQDFNTSMIGMARSLATLETGGMQTNEALVKKFGELALKESDTNWTKMRKLATMRQDAENAIESVMTSPLLGKKQKEFADQLIKDLKSAVPWTPNDVTRLQSAKNPRTTLGDFAEKTGLGKPGFQEGHIYTDANGNKAKYHGMGRWEPVEK